MKLARLRVVNKCARGDTAECRVTRSLADHRQRPSPQDLIARPEGAEAASGPDVAP